MKIVITGATGFIGRALSARLVEEDHRVIALTRNPHRARKILGEAVLCVPWDGETLESWVPQLEGADAIVNLAGENIAAKYWTEKVKKRILESRLSVGKSICEVINRVQKKPGVLIQASAIGYYGHRGEEILDEQAMVGKGFLSEVVQQWESTTLAVQELGVRRVVIRTGLVIGKGGGILSRMKLPFQLFMGGPLGDKRQWISWIHLADEVEAICFLVKREGLGGVFNLCAPEPLRMQEFCKTMARVLKRPCWLPVPPMLLKALLGEMAEEMLLVSQRVLPKRLVTAGYEFLYPTLRVALADALGKRNIPEGYSPI